VHGRSQFRQTIVQPLGGLGNVSPDLDVAVELRFRHIMTVDPALVSRRQLRGTSSSGDDCLMARAIPNVATTAPMTNRL
jgi:hypothetical protein